jgi:hypothetical protein
LDNPGTSVGLLAAFGTNVLPQVGARLLALSTGSARNSSEPGYCGAPSCSTLGAGVAPPGFPLASGTCSVSSNVLDDEALELRIRVPTNATAMRVHYKFYAQDYPSFLCSDFNDQFVILVSPPPQGANNGDVALDANGDAVTVNSPEITECGDPQCVDGTAELSGTWYDTAGATPWLDATWPVHAGDIIVLRFALWDTGDQSNDSTVLIDGLTFLASSVP